MERRSLIVRVIWAACLLIGGVNHALILIQHGPLWDYGGVSWASAAYWSSLTIIDPVIAVLLFARPKFGIPLTIVVIVTNVLHNLAVTIWYAPEDAGLARIANPFLLSQIGFMLFVAVTARTAWKGSRNSTARLQVPASGAGRR